jgi:hypothetical protein
MPAITPHESDAELFTIEDVEKDLASLTDALLEKQVQHLVRELLRRSDIHAALQNIVASGRFANEVEALANAVRILQFAIGVQHKAQS